MSDFPLKTLLTPRSLRVYGRPRPGTGLSLSVPHLPRPKSGSVDLGVVFAGSVAQTRSLARRAAAEARVTLVLAAPAPGRVDSVERGTPLTILDGAATLGPGSGLWTPRITVGIRANAYRSRGRSALIITQSCAMAELVIEAARLRGLGIVGAISLGRDATVPWDQIVRAAAALPRAPALLFAVHQPVSFAGLLRLARAAPRPNLMLTRSAGSLERLPGAIEDFPPDALAVAAALGIPVARTPAELVEIALLRAQGVTGGSGAILAAATTPEEAALLDQALHRAALRCAAPPPGAAPLPSRRGSGASLGQVHLLSKKGDPRRLALACATQGTVDGVLVARDRRLEFLPRPSGRAPGAVAPGRLLANHSTVSALADLQHCDVAPPRRRPRVNLKRARQLLDGWLAPLGELRAKELLACYGLSSPPEQLVNSASSAATVAARIGFPVALKPVGPDLQNRRYLSAVALNVPSAAACRQAFRDVLCACSVLRPPPPLDGVLVSQMVEISRWIDCTLVWLEEITLLRLRWGHEGGGENQPILLACPCSRKQARGAARQLLRDHDGDRARIARLATFINKLSWMGHDLTGRMRWLRLDTVSLPSDRAQSLILDARGEQRDPDVPL